MGVYLVLVRGQTGLVSSHGIVDGTTKSNAPLRLSWIAQKNGEAELGL